MKSLWLTDPVAWKALPLAKKLEALRQHYCTGPCGQSASVLATRQATDDALKEAIKAFEPIKPRKKPKKDKPVVAPMAIYSVNGDTSHLLLVDGLNVINGRYKLVTRRGHDGLFCERTFTPVSYECMVSVIHKDGLIDDVATLRRAERIIAKRDNK